MHWLCKTSSWQKKVSGVGLAGMVLRQKMIQKWIYQYKWQAIFVTAKTHLEQNIVKRLGVSNRNHLTSLISMTD